MIKAARSLSEPFHSLREVSVAGGALRVARAGAPPPVADAVVLAVHGITSSHMAFRTVARELGAVPGVCLLAPDLRGRGQSAGLPGPYGMAAHVADLLAVLDDAGAGRAVLVGHSMGAYVAARLAAENPERAAALVMLDAGPYIPMPPGQDPAELLAQVVEHSVARLRMTFESIDEYVDLWREHPALLQEWNDDVEAYARYDVAGRPGDMRCVVSEAAVEADCTDMIYDESTQRAVDRVRAPLDLVRAPRGLFDDDPMLPDPVVDAFVAAHPDARIEEIENTNHYTMVFGAGPGPRRIARVIEQAIRRNYSVA
ncbi:MAG: lipase [Actinomycetota bacterium]|jgi:pimeloyl-ACP methyl ester carboxylesterase|nr:lipase [Actinomycetota bacterium]